MRTREKASVVTVAFLLIAMLCPVSAAHCEDKMDLVTRRYEAELRYADFTTAPDAARKEINA